jgi:hypothetical protein
MRRSSEPAPPSQNLLRKRRMRAERNTTWKMAGLMPALSDVAITPAGARDDKNFSAAVPAKHWSFGTLPRRKGDFQFVPLHFAVLLHESRLFHEPQTRQTTAEHYSICIQPKTVSTRIVTQGRRHGRAQSAFDLHAQHYRRGLWRSCGINPEWTRMQYRTNPVWFCEIALR